MKQIGIRGCIYKSQPYINIEDALEVLVVGGFYIDEGMRVCKDGLVAEFTSELVEDNSDNKANKASFVIKHFSERELVVLKATRNGIKVSEIARELGVSLRSISFIKAKLRKKLNVRSNPELVPQAMKNRIIV